MNTNFFLLFCVLWGSYIKICLADSANLQDLCPAAPTCNENIFINGLPCKDPASITASDFKSSKLTECADTDNFRRSATTIITASDFPGLNTLGLSIARTDLDVDGSTFPQTHPRATEIFFIGAGVVLAGFIDSKNHVFLKVFKEGDVFVIPRGLLHFCVNAGYESAIIYSVLNSQNPGLISAVDAMFEPTDHDPDLRNMLLRKVKSMSPAYVNGSQ